MHLKEPKTKSEHCRDLIAYATFSIIMSGAFAYTSLLSAVAGSQLVTAIRAWHYNRRPTDDAGIE